MLCPACGEDFAEERCPNCAGKQSAQPHGISPQDAATENPFAADPVPANAGEVTASGESQGDGTGGVIPYKNPRALIAYYLGILSGLPLIGLPFGIAAVVLGIQGLRAKRRNPIVKGSVHAGIGIGCGLVFTLFWTAVLVMLIYAAMESRTAPL